MVQKTGVQPLVIIPKTQKMVLDAALLNTQHYKVANFTFIYFMIKNIETEALNFSI